MTLADYWHDPSGPEPLSSKLGNAQRAVEVIHEGRRAVLDARYEQAARAAGLDDAMIALVLGKPSQP